MQWGGCPFTEAALLLHEGCLKRGMRSRSQQSGSHPGVAALHQRGWWLHGLKQNRTKAGATQSWLLMAITGEASKNGCLTWHQGSITSFPLWFSSAARAGNHHCKAVRFKNKKAFFLGGCGRKRKKGADIYSARGLGAFHRHSPLILTLCSDTGPNFVEQWISTLACRRITWRAY